MRYIIYCDEIGNPRSNPIDEDNCFEIAIETAKWCGTQYKATSLIWDVKTNRDVYLFKGHVKPSRSSGEEAQCDNSGDKVSVGDVGNI